MTDARVEVIDIDIEELSTRISSAITRELGQEYDVDSYCPNEDEDPLMYKVFVRPKPGTRLRLPIERSYLAECKRDSRLSPDWLGHVFQFQEGKRTLIGIDKKCNKYKVLLKHKLGTGWTNITTDQLVRLMSNEEGKVLQEEDYDV